MRLHPAITKEEAYGWLRVEVIEPDESVDREVESALQAMAEAMAAISQVELPEELEPHFP